jgi:hypothetical protein
MQPTKATILLTEMPEDCVVPHAVLALLAECPAEDLRHTLHRDGVDRSRANHIIDRATEMAVQLLNEQLRERDATIRELRGDLDEVQEAMRLVGYAWLAKEALNVRCQYTRCTDCL